MAVGSRAGAADAVAARHGGGDRERGGETRDARAFERDGEDGGRFERERGVGDSGRRVCAADGGAVDAASAANPVHRACNLRCCGVGLARAFAAELGRHRIRVNSLHPGSVATPMGTGRMLDAMAEAAASNPSLRNGFGKQLLPDAVTMPEDVASAVAWLASDESRYVTATAMSVDVGATQG